MIRCTGTAAGYRSGCRCRACRDGINAYNRERQRRMRDRGTKGVYCPAAPVREHVAFLQAQGVTRVAIAEFAGVSACTIWGIASGRRTTLLERSYHAIMGVTVDAVRERGRVPGWKAQRLVAEIRRAGVDRAELAEMLGYSEPAGVSRLFGPQMVERRTLARLAVVTRFLATKGRASAVALEEVGVLG